MDKRSGAREDRDQEPKRCTRRRSPRTQRWEAAARAYRLYIINLVQQRSRFLEDESCSSRLRRAPTCLPVESVTTLIP